MIFYVAYSAEARQDLRDIYEYIAYELLVPETAAGQTERIMKAIRSLEQMPMRHRLYEEEPWHSQGIHKLPVKNYLVYFWVDEEAKKVQVIGIIYGRRDQRHQLSNLDMN